MRPATRRRGVNYMCVILGITVSSPANTPSDQALCCLVGWCRKMSRAELESSFREFRASVVFESPIAIAVSEVALGATKRCPSGHEAFMSVQDARGRAIRFIDDLANVPFPQQVDVPQRTVLVDRRGKPCGTGFRRSERRRQDEEDFCQAINDASVVELPIGEVELFVGEM